MMESAVKPGSPLPASALADRVAIEDLLIDWITAFDDADWNLWTECVADNLRFETVRPDNHSRETLSGAVETLRVLQQRREDFTMSQHALLSSRIRLDGDRARVLTFHLGWLQRPEDKQPASGSYIANFELIRIEGQWRIAACSQSPAWFIWPPEAKSA